MGSSKTAKEIIDDFHNLFYNNNAITWDNTYWLGKRVTKNVFDLWIYQEIMTELRPDIIIECGTKFGGSALFFASICDLLNKGRVITIDIIDYGNLPKHPRIEYLLGKSSTSNDVIEHITEQVTKEQIVLVNLDSDHNKQHVLNELNLYKDIVTVGSYIIVEDTNVHGHPVVPNDPLGPMEAVEEFMKNNNNFIIDKSRERLLLTFNPNGFLKRVK